ncbi:MAG TPA: hypothetical protein VKU19_31055 [Bryobacteraceae bacterium]|nr:hypothetical protein [Bryobacteraceae bacterium]
MRITNQYKEKVFWRAFKGDDTAYVVGLKEGSIDPGKTDNWVDDSFPEIKLEAKTGQNLFATKVLAPAGRRFKMTDDLMVTASGEITQG